MLTYNIKYHMKKYLIAEFAVEISFLLRSTVELAMLGKSTEGTVAAIAIRTFESRSRRCRTFFHRRQFQNCSVLSFRSGSGQIDWPRHSGRQWGKASGNFRDRLFQRNRSRTARISSGQLPMNEGKTKWRRKAKTHQSHGTRSWTQPMAIGQI